ncbi:MAG: class I SAM-dependent methyltransferase [candidate division Zixibacteria bacterium]|nr:class I SAM-dependent methyltransferase [candidate division Zixibacteria bacterium]
MENWPEKKPHKNRFENKPSGRMHPGRLKNAGPATPLSESIWQKKPHKKPSGRLLQIGCREGNFLLNVKKDFGAVFGTDTEANILKEASRRGLPVAQSNGESLPYLTASFDFLVAFDAGKFDSAPGKFLAESSRVLKKEGEMILTLPRRSSLAARLNRYGAIEENAVNWPPLFDAAGLEVFFSGTDALWDSPTFPPVPSFSQKVFFSGLFNLFFLIEPAFPWQFGEKLVFWLKKK